MDFLKTSSDSSDLELPKDSSQKRYGLLQFGLPILMLVLYTVELFRTAWLSDDAYITFRTVYNFIHGYGLRWNVIERVQAYTHPLWMFLISGAYAITGEFYYTVIFLSIVVSLAAVTIMVFRLSGSRIQGAIGALVLMLSVAFVDYSTSGLENPLTYLLLAVFLVLFLSKDSVTFRKMAILALTAALGMVNRMDTALLFLPPLAYLAWKHGKQEGRKRMVTAVAIGFLPFAAWEIFSILYYGFPFPNTAYAKLNTGIPSYLLAGQGLLYFVNSIRWDPITLGTIAVGVAVSVMSKDRRLMSIGLGCMLYLLYVVKIGGDFMSGRYFTAPLFAAVAILVNTRNPFSRRQTYRYGFLALLMVLVLAGQKHTLSNAIAQENAISSDVIDSYGIADERNYYFPGTGLISDPQSPAAQRNDYTVFSSFGAKVRTKGIKVMQWPYIGFFGYNAGPGVYIIDPEALADPLLARLPAFQNRKWRIGHFQRVIPYGYSESVLDKDRLADKRLAQYYDKLRLITRGDIFSMKRLKVIWEMNTGKYEPLIDRQLYSNPPPNTAGSVNW